MKIKPIFTVTLFIVTVAAIMAFRSAEPSPQKFDITGTWRLDSYRYGSDDNPFVTVDQSWPRIKLMTANTFLWVTYDSTSKRITKSAGGKYTLEGSNYTESIDYGYNMDSYLGTQSKFSVNVGDGMFFMTGYLNDGLKIEEVWRKVE